MSLFPNVLIEEPFAAHKESEDDDFFFFCEADAGKTETSAPLSTRRARRSLRQKTERAPTWEGVAEREEMSGEVPGAATGPRLSRFPKQKQLGGASAHPSSCMS